MNFENEKKQCLEKIDKSKKQSVDKGVKDVVDFLNSLDDYYTTSSCSGRIMLIEKPETGKKNDAEWLFVSHDKVDANEVFAAVKGNNAWFKQEGAILHVCCRTMDAAEKLLSIVRENGFKRSGLINFKKRIIVELMSTEQVEAPVIVEGKKAVHDDYISILADSANKNMEKNMKRIEELYKALKSVFSDQKL